jgi:hypothetical protein
LGFRLVLVLWFRFRLGCSLRFGFRLWVSAHSLDTGLGMPWYIFDLGEMPRVRHRVRVRDQN